MADVKWIKFKVGTFDGASFKRIKKAKLADGTSYRDRLTAIWFELLDLAGKNNLDGKLIDSKELELPFDFENQYQDIATMIDRESEEVKCAIAWFVKNKMIEVIDNVYCLSNWCKYQSIRTIDDVREQTKLRVRKYRKNQKLVECNATSNVTETLSNAPRNKNKEIEEEIDTTINSCCLEHKNNIPTIDEVKSYCISKNYTFDVNKMYSYYSSKNWELKDNVKIKNWQAVCDLWQANEEKFKTTNKDITLEDWQIEGMKGIMEDFKK